MPRQTDGHRAREPSIAGQPCRPQPPDVCLATHYRKMRLPGFLHRLAGGRWSNHTRNRTTIGTGCSAFAEHDISHRAPLRHGDVADVLRYLIAPLHRRAAGDRHIPALYVRISVEVDGLPFEPGNPRP